MRSHVRSQRSQRSQRRSQWSQRKAGCIIVPCGLIFALRPHTIGAVADEPIGAVPLRPTFEFSSNENCASKLKMTAQCACFSNAGDLPPCLDVDVVMKLRLLIPSTNPIGGVVVRLGLFLLQLLCLLDEMIRKPPFATAPARLHTNSRAAFAVTLMQNGGPLGLLVGVPEERQTRHDVVRNNFARRRRVTHAAARCLSQGRTVSLDYDGTEPAPKSRLSWLLRDFLGWQQFARSRRAGLGALETCPVPHVTSSQRSCE